MKYITKNTEEFVKWILTDFLHRYLSLRGETAFKPASDTRSRSVGDCRT